MTSLNRKHQRVSMHGIRKELLDLQAKAIGLPVIYYRLPDGCSCENYEKILLRALTRLQRKGIRALAYGDLFLEDVRRYRERVHARTPVVAVFPLWGKDTASLARTVVELGFRAIVVCVDTRALPEEFLGRTFDWRFLRDLPKGVDPMGENGEFHTFVTDGPIFREPLSVEPGQTHAEEPFLWLDLLPKEATVHAAP